MKMVPPSKRFVSDVELAPCMLDCPVHVSKRKPRVQWLNWWKRKKFSFHFSNAIFSAFPFLPMFYLYLPPSYFSHTHQNSPWSFSFLLKPSSPSSLKNHHHRQRSTVDFWRTKRSLIKVSLTFISPSPPARFHHFFAHFFLFSFLVFKDQVVFSTFCILFCNACLSRTKLIVSYIIQGLIWCFIT